MSDKIFDVKYGSIYKNSTGCVMGTMAFIVDINTSALKYGDVSIGLDSYYFEMIDKYNKLGLYDIANDLIYIEFDRYEGVLTIESIFEENKYQTFSSNCIEVLYFPQKAFTPTDILYTTPKQNNYSEKSNTLKVSDLLSVAKYSLQVLEIIQPNEKTSDVSDAITVMQSIDLALNNKPYDKPLNKSLHIVNSVLTSVVKRNLENESDKRFVSTMGLLIDLAIDFFTARK